MFNGLAQLSKRYRQLDNGMGECVDASYANFIQDMKKPVFNAARTWVFQVKPLNSVRTKSPN